MSIEKEIIYTKLIPLCPKCNVPTIRKNIPFAVMFGGGYIRYEIYDENGDSISDPTTVSMWHCESCGTKYSIMKDRNNKEFYRFD